jgi:phenylalanyl-tRNA synthetase beta chain
VFDAAKVKGNLTVRRAVDGEEVLALDGTRPTRSTGTASSPMTMASSRSAASWAAKHSGCDENTTDVLIESALWDPINIARPAASSGSSPMRATASSAASIRPSWCPGLERDPAGRRYLRRYGRRDRCDRLCRLQRQGRRFPGFRSEAPDGSRGPARREHPILKGLGFGVEGSGERVSVSVPSWRPDVDGKADLVEEVMRIHGVDRIKPEPIESLGAVNGKILTTLQIRTRLAKRSLAARGMLEAVTWSFISKAQAELFGGGAPSAVAGKPDRRRHVGHAAVAAARPPDCRPAQCRQGLRRCGDLRRSGTYENDTPSGQRRVAGGIRRGTASLAGAGRSWSNATKGGGKPVDVFDAKADAIAVLEACGVPMGNVQFEAGGPSWYHPGRSGTIKLGPKIILGTFGEFHPKVLEALDVSGALAGFEVYVDAMPEPKKKATRTKPALELSPFQAVKRDFAFVVDKSVEAGAILKAASSADRKLVTGVNVFDIFEGASVGEGKKSVAIEVVIQPADRTLTDEDFEVLTGKIIANVTKNTGGVLRA